MSEPKSLNWRSNFNPCADCPPLTAHRGAAFAEQIVVQDVGDRSDRAVELFARHGRAAREASHDAVRSRIAAFDEADLLRQTWFINASIATLVDLPAGGGYSGSRSRKISDAGIGWAPTCIATSTASVTRRKMGSGCSRYFLTARRRGPSLS